MCVSLHCEYAAQVYLPLHTTVEQEHNNYMIEAAPLSKGDLQNAESAESCA